RRSAAAKRWRRRPRGSCPRCSTLHASATRHCAPWETPCSAVSTVDPKRNDLPALAEADMPAWWRGVQEIPNEVQREALLFCLLSGLRRNSLVELQWKDLDLKRRCIRIGNPKGGQERAFDLILSRPMIRCL